MVTKSTSVTRLMSEPRTSRPWSPPVDIVETELEDIDVRVENDTLSLKGERRFEKECAEKGYHRIERSYGSFVRSFASRVRWTRRRFRRTIKMAS